MEYNNDNYIEGRNAVLEAYRSGKTIDKLYRDVYNLSIIKY